MLRGAVVIALLLAGCATTNPVVPAGTQIYFEGVSYVGEERVSMGRTLAPFVEVEVRKLIGGAGVVTLVTAAERATADYDLAIRITDVRHHLDIHLLYGPDDPEVPGESYSYTSLILIEGESRLTPIAGEGQVIAAQSEDSPA